MNCLEWEERVALYAGGDLAPEEASAVQQHVAGCAGCQLLLGDLRESLALVGEAHNEPLEAAHFAAVRARVLAEIEGGRARRWRFAWTYAVAAAAVILLVSLWPRREQRMFVPMPSGPAAPSVAKVELPVPPVVHPRRTATVVAKVNPPQEPTEPTVVKLLTDDPDVVIYWITSTKGE